MIRTSEQNCSDYATQLVQSVSAGRSHYVRKLIIATAVVLLLGTGNGLAVDALETEQSIIKLFIYDKDCAPLPDSWREMVTTMLRAMGETDRARALMVVSAAVGGHREEFCKAMEPGVKQLGQ